MANARPIVLFLCTGNSCRSQMAEGLLRAIAGDRYEVHSAGTEPRDAVHPLAVAVMREIGIDVSAHRPKSVGEFLGRVPVRHLITVCGHAEAHCPRTFPGVVDRLFWPFDDPAAATGPADQTLLVFRRVRDEIRQRITEWTAPVLEPASPDSE